MRGTYYAQRVVPCECGSRDAYWHGGALRVYACDPCWAKHPQNPDRAPPKLRGR